MFVYTALVLNHESRALLIEKFKEHIPDGWEIIAHHMTINLGPSEYGPAHDMVNNNGEVLVTMLGKSDKAIAVCVETVIPSKNAIKHITLAVNKAGGGKAKDSNNIVDWEVVPSFFLQGVIREVF